MAKFHLEKLQLGKVKMRLHKVSIDWHTFIGVLSGRCCCVTQKPESKILFIPLFFYKSQSPENEIAYSEMRY